MGSTLAPYKTHLGHVPADTQKALLALVAILKEHCKDLEQAWLFGSYARGDFVRDRRVEQDSQLVSEYRSDIDVLVICRKSYTVKKNSIWHKVSKAITAHPDINDHVHLIREHIGRVHDALTHSEYFYLDILKEGVVLFGEDVALPQPQHLTPKTRREYAINYLKDFYERANDFQTIFEKSYRLKKDRITMFGLHQLTERLFYTFLLVHTHYKPRTHDLEAMRDQVAAMKKDIFSVFPKETHFDKKYFQFLVDAYIDSRYKNDYKVDPDVLEILAKWVQEFQAWVLKECLQCIDAFIPDQPYSPIYERPGEPLDFETLKATPLPEETVADQEKLLAEQQLQMDEFFAREREKDEALALALEGESKERQEKLAERRAKEKALAERDKERLEKERERKEKEAALERERQLIQKLRDSGIEPE